MIKKPLGEVIVHHFDICSGWSTRSIPLVELRPTTGQVSLLLGIVEYDHLVTLTLHSCKGDVKKLLPDVGHFRLTFEQFAGLLVFDQ